MNAAIAHALRMERKLWLRETAVIRKLAQGDTHHSPRTSRESRNATDREYGVDPITDAKRSKLYFVRATGTTKYQVNPGVEQLVRSAVVPPRLSLASELSDLVPCHLGRGFRGPNGWLQE